MGDDKYANVSICYKGEDNELHEVPVKSATFEFDGGEITVNSSHAYDPLHYDPVAIAQTVELAIDGIGTLLKGFMDERVFNVSPVKKVVFNDPATVVYWIDGSKTVVKRSEDDEWDPEKGLLLCFMKRMFGNTGRYNDVLKEWMREGE